MSPEVALYTRLAADDALVDLVADRIYIAGDVPQPPTFPLVTYQLLPGTPLGITHDSKRHSRRARIQVDIYGTGGPVELALIEAAIEVSLHGARWLTSDGDAAVSFQARGPGDLPADDETKSEPGLKPFRRSADYFVHFRKAA